MEKTMKPGSFMFTGKDNQTNERKTNERKTKKKPDQKQNTTKAVIFIFF
jgi:hypothetical protein